MHYFLQTSLIIWLFCLSLISTSTCSFAEDRLYTVKPGDTLWSISEEWLKDAREWEKLQSLNNIANPRTLIPNSQIIIPDILLKKEANLAVVKYVQGNVSIKNTQGQRQNEIQKLQTGMELQEGDEIVTSVASSIGIKFKNGSVSTLQEGSQLTINKIELAPKNNDIQLHLLQGSINNKVTKEKDKASRFTISTPSAVASVRGTNFRVANDTVTQQFRAEVLEGSVAVSSQGESKLVEKGFGVVVKKDKPPGELTKLLPAVDLSNLESVFKRKPMYFRFKPVTDALAYRVELSKAELSSVDSDEGDMFNQPIYGEDISEPVVKFTELENGKYVLKVFPYDKNGLGGKVAYHHFDVRIASKALPPKNPELVFPEHEALLNQENFIFKWSASADANAYRFQLAYDEKFSQLHMDVFPHYFTTLAVSDRLPSGKYYWHVAALDKDHRVHSFTDLQSFRIPPHIPVLEEPAYVDGKVNIKWSKGKNSLRYQLQVSRNKAFENILFSKTLTAPYYLMELEDLGDYYVRAISVDTDNYLSKASSVKHFRISKKGFFGRKLDNMAPVTE